MIGSTTRKAAQQERQHNREGSTPRKAAQQGRQHSKKGSTTRKAMLEQEAPVSIIFGRHPYPNKVTYSESFRQELSIGICMVDIAFPAYHIARSVTHIQRVSALLHLTQETKEKERRRCKKTCMELDG
jgi:hypothetical protein